MWNAWLGSLCITSVPVLVNCVGWFTPASCENHFVRHVLKAQTIFRAVSLVFLFLFSFSCFNSCCFTGEFAVSVELLHNTISAWKQWRRISRDNCRAVLSQRRVVPASSAGCQRHPYLQQLCQVHQWGQSYCWKALCSSNSAGRKNLRWIPNANRNFASEHHCWQTWWGQPFISQCVQHVVSSVSLGLNSAWGITVFEKTTTIKLYLKRYIHCVSPK